MLEVGGALRFRLEAEATSSNFLPLSSNHESHTFYFFASNLRPNANTGYAGIRSSTSNSGLAPILKGK
jgi:hypothetical protein